MSNDDTAPDATASAASTAPPAQSSSSALEKKRKRKPKTQTTTQITIRNARWSYLHLQQVTTARTATSGDAVTAHLQVTAALSQFLGLHGAAIPVDILKLDGADLWIRVPAEDNSAVVAAIGGWLSGKGEAWKVKGTSSWDARAQARDSGQDLFND
ncbi:hypothetical protein LTR85_006553 [Meristemomyces frigidus]|nr:hypothetical protein LTR85_006553 [Meristemomyces frigidus]